MLTRKQWTEANYPAARKATAGSGIFPETLLAIAIVESQGRVGNSYYPGAGLVARKANNFFGIKEGTSWTGPTIELPTPGDVEKISIFRVYPNFQNSAADFVRFLKRNSRYTRAGVFQANSYQEQILAIARAGYSESPQYAEVLTNVADSVQKTVTKIANNLMEGGKWIIPILAVGFFFVNSLNNETDSK
jgi:flagellar protein FlgJ